MRACVCACVCVWAKSIHIQYPITHFVIGDDLVDCAFLLTYYNYYTTLHTAARLLVRNIFDHLIWGPGDGLDHACAST